MLGLPVVILVMWRCFKAGFQQVAFKDCKILGVHFQYLRNPFLLEVQASIAVSSNYLQFLQSPDQKTTFIPVECNEAKFTQADVKWWEVFRDSCTSTGVIFWSNGFWEKLISEMLKISRSTLSSIAQRGFFLEFGWIAWLVGEDGLGWIGSSCGNVGLSVVRFVGCG